MNYFIFQIYYTFVDFTLDSCYYVFILHFLLIKPTYSCLLLTLNINLSSLNISGAAAVVSNTLSSERTSYSGALLFLLTILRDTAGTCCLAGRFNFMPYWIILLVTTVLLFETPWGRADVQDDLFYYRTGLSFWQPRSLLGRQLN